jgi:hypothetical protein
LGFVSPLGANLARHEIAIMFEQLLPALPTPKSWRHLPTVDSPSTNLCWVLCAISRYA